MSQLCSLCVEFGSEHSIMEERFDSLLHGRGGELREYMKGMGKREKMARGYVARSRQ